MDLWNINKFMIPKLFFGNFMKSFSLKFYDCMAIYAIAIFRLYIILSLLIFCSAIYKLQIVNSTF